MSSGGIIVGKPCRFDLSLLVSLILAFFIPNFFYVAFGFASLAAGMLVSAFLIFLLNTKGFIFREIRLSRLVCFYGVFLALCSFSIFIFLTTGESKSLLSLGLVFVVIAAVSLGQRVFDAEYSVVEYSVFAVLMSLLFLGWLKFLWQPLFFGYEVLGKPVFPFSEESHYALFLGLLASGVVVNAGYKVCLFLLVNMLALSFLLPSLSLLVFSLVVCFLFFIRVRLVYLVFLLLFLLSVAIFVFYFYLSGFEYFQSRLNFSGSTNLTVMVFLQGWWLAYTNFVETSGFGLGFQRLGAEGTFLPPISEEIYRVAGGYFNIPDGGFLAAKLIAEFGVLGVCITLGYCLFLFYITLFLNRNLRKVRSMDSADRDVFRKFFLAGGILFGFSVEFFLRGIGYFSPGLFVVFSALVVLYNAKAQLRRILIL